MTSICVAYDVSFERDWDDLILRSSLHTILHSRAFLAYHGDRFHDESIVIRDAESGFSHAVLPAARHPSEPSMVVSHPGSTFGGLLQRKLDPFAYAQGMELVIDWYRRAGYSKLRLKTTPTFASAQANEIAIHHGLQHGQLAAADLWSYIQLDRPVFTSDKRRSSVKAAIRKGARARWAASEEDWRFFYSILRANLRSRHDAAPVHTLDEFLDVRARLGDRSRLMVSVNSSDEIYAGVWLIDYGQKAMHTQYIASTPDGRAANAVDLLLSECIDRCREEGYLIFSFGISNDTDSWNVNETLVRYKARFGGGLCLHYTFDYQL